jgi:hypothetical protein
MIRQHVIKTFLGIAVLGHVMSAYAGGMSSAGEVTFKPIIRCSVDSIDPTFPTVTDHVDIVKETDWDDNIDWNNPSLTLVTYNVLGEVLRYHPLDENVVLNYPTALPAAITVLKYRAGSQGNVNLGQVVFNGPVGPSTGRILSNSGELEELLLKGCTWVVDARN